MALYLGNERVKINLNGSVYLIPNDSPPVINTGKIKLLLPDGCALKESTGLYLVYKEDE